METELSPEQSEARGAFLRFTAEHVSPFADAWDTQQALPTELIQEMAAAGYLGGPVPEDRGGQGMDAVTLGLLCEAVGGGSASLVSLLTVHGMVCEVLTRWGSEEQQSTWLPALARGEKLGAFGLTEPDVGSDASSVRTVAMADGDEYVLNGAKKWISCAQIADVFLVVGQCDAKPAAFLVERETPGLRIEPIIDMLGFRAAGLAQVNMADCRIPAGNLVGRVGFGFSAVASTALDYGRFCVGWGCLGMAQACLDASLTYSSQRQQFGSFLKGHQLIQEMVANMIADIRAMRLLCYHAACLKNKGVPELIMETSIAKYFASRSVARIASDAVQIHGANGCSSDYPVQRYYRDAKIMEIIEGSNQMQQTIIAKSGYMEEAVERRRRRRAAAGSQD